jgi:hypothetical protein
MKKFLNVFLRVFWWQKTEPKPHFYADLNESVHFEELTSPSLLKNTIFKNITLQTELAAQHFGVQQIYRTN